MGVPGNANALLLKSAAAAGGYQISRSLRFNSSDSGFCSRTPTSAGNRKTWTWSAWVKRSGLSTFQNLFGTADTSFSNGTYIWFIDNNTFRVEDYGASSVIWRLTTSQVLRDPSAWFHLLVACDTTQATAANRVRVYINGAEVTAFSTATYPTQNLDTQLNTTAAHGIGRAGTYNNYYFDGYLADIYFIDGAALTPSSFGEFDATTGVWNPKTPTGLSYGTNGFHLDFADNSNNTATTLGKDTANSNNWTPNNFSVTAGAGNDSLVDTPTSYGTDDSLGGSVRGNYCTWNPLFKPVGLAFGVDTPTLSNGNLDAATIAGSNWNPGASTFALTSGKWYAEFTRGGTGGANIGITPPSSNFTGANVIHAFQGHFYDAGGSLWNGSTNTGGYASYSAGDVVGIAVDFTASTVAFYKNGSLIASVSLNSNVVNNGCVFAFSMSHSSSFTANFGQRAWAYTPPSNHRPIVDTLLPSPVIAKPSTVMDVKLYTGNGSTQSITGLGFNPDLVWIKSRSNLQSHHLHDAVRGAGAGKNLMSNSTDAEGVDSSNYGYLSAFNSDGFSVAAGSIGADFVNKSAWTYAAWCFDAGANTVTNNAGSISSSVRANASAGFSIVTYTGTGTWGSTVGHGLGVKPEFIIVKSRTSSGGSYNWMVYHKDLTNSEYYIILDSTAQQTTLSQPLWTVLNSSTLELYSQSRYNGNGGNYVMYCWASVPGFSSFGKYVASSGLPFVYLGFRPRFLLIKNITTGSTNWRIIDSARDTYNDGSGAYWLKANTSDAEVDERPVDFLSNGFKLRMTDAGDLNYSSDTYIYAAFAESPFQYARAR